MEKDLFGSILYLALQIKINMEDVLTYPLTATPLSLCHIDGKMYKATKNTSMKELEKSSVSNNTERIQVAIVKELALLICFLKFLVNTNGIFWADCDLQSRIW